MWKIYKKLKGKIAIALCTCLVLALCFPFEAQALTIDSGDIYAADSPESISIPGKLEPKFYSLTNTCLSLYNDSDKYIGSRVIWNQHLLSPQYYDKETGFVSYGYNWVQNSPDSHSIGYIPYFALYCDFDEMVFLPEHSYSVQLDVYYADGSPFTGKKSTWFAVFPHVIQDLFPFTGLTDSFSSSPTLSSLPAPPYFSSSGTVYFSQRNSVSFSNSSASVSFTFTVPSGMTGLAFGYGIDDINSSPIRRSSVNNSWAFDNVVITDYTANTTWSFADLPRYDPDNPGGGGESETTPPSGGGSVPEPVTPDVAQGVEDGLNNVAPDTDKYNQSQQDANNQLDDMQGQADDLYNSLDGIDVPDFKPSDWDIFKSAPVVMTWLGNIWDHLGVWQYVILAFLASGIVVTIIGVVSRYRN